MALISDLAETIAEWAEATVAPILDPDPPANIVYGDVAIDECCPNDLTVAVGNLFPLAVETPQNCEQPWAVTISVVVTGCVDTLDANGRPLDAWPQMSVILDAGQALYQGMCNLDVGDDWRLGHVSLSPLGAQGGCISSVLTLTAWVM